MTPPKNQVPGHDVDVTEAQNGQTIVECTCGLWVVVECRCANPMDIPDERWDQHMVEHGRNVKRVHLKVLREGMTSPALALYDSARLANLAAAR
jgi:hypothetical protein